MFIKQRSICHAGDIEILRNHHPYVFFTKRTQSPHIHAIYNEDVAAIDFMTGDVLEGHLPPKAMSMVLEWIALHREELHTMWKTQEFQKLAPLE